jgi:hypothetical protein
MTQRSSPQTHCRPRELNLRILQDALAREAAEEAADQAAREAKRQEVGLRHCRARGSAATSGGAATQPGA